MEFEWKLNALSNHVPERWKNTEQAHDKAGDFLTKLVLCKKQGLSYINFRSRLRYWIASARCCSWMFSAPSRSAIVRATLRIRV